MKNSVALDQHDSRTYDRQIAELLAKMTLEEKIGQMRQVNAGEDHVPDWLRGELQAGNVGSVLNQVDLDTVNELQRISVEQSRLGIPLLVGRDVIHGFKTVFPIPLGQAASWNPQLVRDGARVAAQEAAASGINWTFAPMIDISRDPRWGRIAEGFGEDPYLTGVLGAAMVEGFQGDDLADTGTIAACAKHFAGYGASEAGRDYNTTNIPQSELRNVHLRPFKAAVDAGVATLMTSFSDVNGIPATGNEFLLKTVLRDEWQFDGFVVSDWDSIWQLSVHGLTENDKESAYQAVTAGVNMEMAGKTYANHLAELVAEQRVSVQQIDRMVTAILRVKFELGLFEDPYTDAAQFAPNANAQYLQTARVAALQSVVLLSNEQQTLPLSRDSIRSLAVIGPMADAPYEQLGTWIFDGDASLTQTALQAIRELAGEQIEVRFSRAMETTRSRSTEMFQEAIDIAGDSDAVLLFLGEESILSGEAHSRADINLPGNQADLVRAIRNTGKPVVAIIMAGRPLTLSNIVDEVDAILYAWHPGTMGGPAIADLLFGIEVPSGKLPVTFPRVVGQIPVYYAHKNTGKPASPETFVHIDDIDAQAPQTSFGMTSFHLDAGFTPLFPFGFGLSYSRFEYTDIRLDRQEISMGDTLTVSATLTNAGEYDADEVVQLYIRDPVASLTRPVRELAGFRRVRLAAGESANVAFELHTDDLAFYGRQMRRVTEAGEFQVWIGGSSDTQLGAGFRLRAAR